MYTMLKKAGVPMRTVKKLVAFIKKDERRYELITYCMIGGLTTLVNFAALNVFVYGLKWDETLSNAAAIVLSILFAYVTNKKIVFRRHCENLSALLTEMAAFFASRALTFVLDLGGVYLLYNVWGYDLNLSKLALQVAVIVINFILGKFFVFRKVKKV